MGIILLCFSCSEKPTEPPEEIKPPPLKESKWKNLGLNDLRIYKVAVNPMNDFIIYVSCLINTPTRAEEFMLRTEDGGLSWDTLNLKGHVNEFAFDLSNANTLYCAGHFYDGVDVDTSTNDAIFIKSTAAGKSWIRIEDGIKRSRYDLGFDIEVDFNNPNILFATAYTGRFFKSYDAGLSWVELYINSFPMTNLEIDRYDSNILVTFFKYSFIIGKYDAFQNLGTINLSYDGGKTFTGILSVNSVVSDVSISLWNKGELFAYISGNDSLSGLVYSSNYGKIWKVKSKQVAADINFSNNFGRIIYDTSKEGFIYARLKDSTGVYWSSDYGTSWQKLSDPAVISLVGISSSGKYLYGTDSTGYGLFRYELK